PPSTPVAGFLIALVDRQKAIFHRQGKHRHRGGVNGTEAVAADPGTVVVLVIEEPLVQLGPEEIPVIVAELEHSLRDVVDAVEEMLVSPARRLLEEIRAGLQGFAALVPPLAA